MSDNMNAEPATRKPKKTNWLLIVGAVVAIIACLCALLFGATMMSPTIMAQTLPSACQQRYPSLGATACADWAAKIRDDHFSEYLHCFDGTVAANSFDQAGIMACLEQQGLAPDK